MLHHWYTVKKKRLRIIQVGSKQVCTILQNDSCYFSFTINNVFLEHLERRLKVGMYYSSLLSKASAPTHLQQKLLFDQLRRNSPLFSN